MQPAQGRRPRLAVVKEVEHQMGIVVSAGVDDLSQVIVDPGLGFTKTRENDWTLLTDPVGPVLEHDGVRLPPQDPRRPGQHRFGGADGMTPEDATAWALTRLNTALYHHYDRREHAAVLEFFAADALYEVHGRELRGHAEILEELNARPGPEVTVGAEPRPHPRGQLLLFGAGAAGPAGVARSMAL
jgi:hypothetical protein